MARFTMKLALLSSLLLLHATVQAFVTSATLEYCNPHPTRFYLNGVELKNYDTQFTRTFDYALLCSADGSLPLELFKYRQENLLAISQTGRGGWHEFTNMGVSYRLTVYQSAGSPVVIWSEPGNTKFLHLDPGGRVPAGWNKVGFDDSTWSEAIAARMITDYWGWPELVDPAFKGFLGNEGYVPFLSHNKRGDARADMINLFRSTFRVPDKPGKLVVYATPKQAKLGEKVAVRLIPALDGASAGNLQFFAILPKGLDPVQAPGAAFDAAKRRLSWSYPSPAKSTAIHLVSVAENNGFVLPQKAFGPWKANRPPSDFIRGITKSEYYDSASFPSGSSIWYKMSPPPFADGPGSPIILSVTFQSQLLPRGFNGLISYSVEHIMFNYSVTNALQGFLKEEGVNITHHMGSNSGQYWTNGYYDATYDRRWTWTDLSNLKVHFFAKQIGGRKLDNLLLSCIASVRYYNPADVAPLFYAQVSDPTCSSLSITAAMQSLSNDLSVQASDSIRVNLASCAPTPVPTATTVPTRVPTPRPGVTPPPTPRNTPTPITTYAAVAAFKPSFSEVSSSPEPFKRGGVYIYFSLSNPCDKVILNVYNAAGAKMATVDGGSFQSGKSGLFYNGQNDKGRPLAAGSYQYELVAGTERFAETFRGRFTKAGDKFN